MEDKKPIPIDENALREKLLNYHVSFNPASLDFLENEIDHVKTRAPLKLPETKKILQFAAVPVIIAVFGAIAYFGFNYIKDIADNTAAKKDTTVVVKPKVEPKPEVKKEEVKPPVIATTSIVPEVKKQDTIVATATVAGVPKQIKDSNKKPTEQVVAPKKDTVQPNNTVSTKPDTIKKNTIADTSSASKNKDGATKKKKKKKKNSDVTDDIRQSTQQPNSADDDVVVPNN